MTHLLTSVAEFILVPMQWVIFFYFFSVNSFYAVLLVSAAVEMRKHMLQVRGESLWRVLSSPVAPTISLLAPAYNEEATIETSVRAFLALHYPNLEVVIINDGSMDRTLDILIEQFDLAPVHLMYWKRVKTKPVRGIYRSRRHPNLIVVDKENGGKKADGTNAGLNLATGDLVCVMDADTLIEPDALQRMVRPFLMADDVLGVGGTIRVVNACGVRDGRMTSCRVPRRPLPGIQVAEYLRAFLFGRMGWNRLGGNLIISGAFGLFRREAVIATGGYQTDSIGEDMELVVRLRRYGYEQKGPHRVDFVPDPVAWTEAPETLRGLGSQRERWHRGLSDVLWRHRNLLFNPRFGAMGLVVVPYFLLAEWLAPVMEGLGLFSIIVGLAFGLLNLPFAILFFLVAYGYSLILTSTTLVLEEINYHRYEGAWNRILLVFWMLIENCGYRQLTVIFRLRGLIKYFRGQNSWQVMERKGFGSPDTIRP